MVDDKDEKINKDNGEIDLSIGPSIYLSYSPKDASTVNKISSILEKYFDLVHDHHPDNSISFNENLEKIISADIYVIIVSDNYLMSPICSAEKRNIIAHTSVTKKSVIAVFLENTSIKIPSELLFIESIQDDQHPSYEDLAKKLVDKIFNALSFVTIQQLQAKEKIEKIETSFLDHIQPIINDLENRQARLNRWGVFYNFIGLGAIFGALIFSALTFYYTVTDARQKDLFDTLFLAIKGGVLLTLVIAFSKYAFTVSKSYMNESLKVADRVHAIRFGQFYLKVFEGDLNGGDFKEIFQHWNYSQESSFSNLKTDSFDPKTIDSLSKLISAAKEVVKN